MSDSILKFANKLEIRYSFNNKSNYMDAMTKHRCEKEILTLIRSLADMLDVKLTVYNEPYDKEGGFREKLGVKRDQFDYFILRSDDLPTVKDNKATIEIISPVLKDSKYRWKGIYNKGGETIDFYMQDEDFKKQMFEDKISFTSGMCIDCVLEIARRLSELGEVVNVSYTVTTVIRTRFDKMEIVTPQGKRHLRKLEAAKKQLTLDLFG